MVKQTSKTPALRFPEFSGEWEIVEIQKLIDKKAIISHLDGNHGALYPSSDEFVDSGIPYITANDFVDGFVDFKKCKHLPIKRAAEFKKGIAKDGDVLFAHNATVGPTAILKTSYDYVVLSTTATYFRCDNIILKNAYLRNFFCANSFISQYRRVMSQSTRNQVPITTQRKFFVNLPTLPEQEKIADFLGAVDEKIQQLTRKKELLEQYKKGVMQRIFSQELRFKDDDGRDFPDWEEKRLGDFLTFHSTNSFSRELLNYESGAVKNIHYGDIHKNFNSHFKLQREIVPFVNSNVDLSKVKEDSFCQVGDLVIADASEDYKDVGKAIEIIDLNSETLIAGLHTYIARDNTNITATGFKGYLMQSSEVRRQIMRLATGISVLGISKGNISIVEVLLPSKPEQEKIADFLSAIDDKITLASNQLDAAKALKKGLLQKMFV